MTLHSLSSETENGMIFKYSVNSNATNIFHLISLYDVKLQLVGIYYGNNEGKSF